MTEKRLREAIARIDELDRRLFKVAQNTKPLFGGETILTEPDLVKMFDICERTLQKWRSEGKIPYISIGNDGSKVFYLASDVEIMLRKNYKHKK